MGIGWVGGGGGLMWVSTETDPPFPYHEPLIPNPKPDYWTVKDLRQMQIFKFFRIWNNEFGRRNLN